MQTFLIIVSLAFAVAGPAYNYQPQQLHTNTNGLSNSNNQGHQFLQDALQNSQIFSQPSSFNFNNQQFAPNNQFQQNQFNNQAYAPIVTKDIFVHVPPSEPEEHYQTQPAPVLQPRKHYRIVFIKAPTEKVSAASLRIHQAPVEEKTIIYVLSKKPDPLELESVLQNVAPTQPSKPEVYFIKYKTQEEAAHAQQSIQAQYDKLGGTSEFSDEGVAPVTSVIGSLQNQQSSNPSANQFGTLSNEGSSSYLPPNH